MAKKKTKVAKRKKKTPKERALLRGRSKSKHVKNQIWTPSQKARILAYVWHNGSISAAVRKYGCTRTAIRRWMKSQVTEIRELSELKEVAHEQCTENTYEILRTVTERLRHKLQGKKGVRLDATALSKIADQMARIAQNMEGIQIRFSGGIDHTISTGEIDDRIELYKKLLGSSATPGDGNGDADSEDDAEGDSKGNSDG